MLIQLNRNGNLGGWNVDYTDHIILCIFIYFNLLGVGDIYLRSVYFSSTLLLLLFDMIALLFEANAPYFWPLLICFNLSPCFYTCNYRLVLLIYEFNSNLVLLFLF